MSLFDLRSQSQKQGDELGKTEDTLSKRPYGQVQLFFLLRLMHLLDQRRNHDEADEGPIKLLDRAIYSTFMDCLEQGVGDDARSLLHQNEPAKKS